MHLEASRSKLRMSVSVHPLAAGYMLLASGSAFPLPPPPHPIEVPTMTRNPKAPITSVACVMLEYGKQRRFRIKVDVFDFGVFN